MLKGPSGRATEVMSVWICPDRPGSAEVRCRLSRRRMMTHKVFDIVVLRADLPEYGLPKGDLGAVVHVYEPDGLEVEFVTASGKAEALVTLKDGCPCDPWSITIFQ
jgi:hypothetical protein